MNVVGFFRRISITIHPLVTGIQTDKPYNRLTANITEWFKNEVNLPNCKNSCTGYHGMIETES